MCSSTRTKRRVLIAWLCQITKQTSVFECELYLVFPSSIVPQLQFIFTVFPLLYMNWNHVFLHPQEARHTWVTSQKWFTILMSSYSLQSKRTQPAADHAIIPFHLVGSLCSLGSLYWVYRHFYMRSVNCVNVWFCKSGKWEKINTFICFYNCVLQQAHKQNSYL